MRVEKLTGAAIVLTIVTLAVPGEGLALSTTFSPLLAVASGASGPDSAVIAVAPHCCPSTALEVTASQTVAENDFQWVLFPLPLPRTGKFRTISRVTVCYEVAGGAGTYISQTRLTEMEEPTAALVLHDDGTNRSSGTATCYQVATNTRPAGTVTLALKVVFGNASDAIRIGMIKLRTKK